MTVWKEPADLATTEALGAGPAFPTSGVIDGVALKLGDRVLVKDQFTSTENGYYVVAGAPPTLIATGDTVEAEDIIRVNQGEKNAHTAWALVDATDRVFIRQDVKHYSFDSIAELKLFRQALPNATATVANYDAARDDKGGGDFTFIGVPADGSATISAAVATRVSISGATVSSGVVTITAVGHGLAVGSVASVFLGGPMTPSGAVFVLVRDVDTLEVIDASTGSWAAGAYISFVTITTSAPHRRVRGERIAVGGVSALPTASAPGSALPSAINRAWDSAGVIDDKNLTIPVDTISGSYMVGGNAVIGDDALLVAATDSTGAVGGLWRRTVASPIDVRWFGAFPDFDPDPAKLSGTDNLLAFNAALAAGGRRGGRLVADGWFYLSNTLHIRKSVIFEGTGRNAPTAPGLRCAPGTWLVFPANVTGIQLHTDYEPTGAADQTVLRNLTLWCMHERACLGPDRGQAGEGIWINCPAYCEHVYVQNFGANGILVDSGQGGHIGNAGGFLLTKCTVGGCGGDGIRIQGGDSTVGLITSCSAEGNYGYGFYDLTPAGTCYLACHGAFNTGYSGNPGLSKDYKTEGSSNSSLYLNCYSESGENEVAGRALVIGGVLSQAPYNPTPGNACMIGPGGAVSGNPLYYANTSGPVTAQIEFGQQEDAGPAHGGVLNFLLPAAGDPNVIRYDSTTGWWGLDNSGAHDRTSFRFPTSISAPRRVAPLFEHGIYYGPPSLLSDVGASKALVNHIGLTEIPTDGTWEVGDVVWNTSPVAGGPIGWVCTKAGTQDAALVGVTGAVDMMDGTLLTLDVLPGSLAKWQYIKIASVEGVYQIVNDPVHPSPDPVFTLRIDPAAPVGAGPGAIDFSRAAFSTFGPVENVGVSASYGSADSPRALLPSERYVTVTSDATMTLPASPADGQTYYIKSQAGVTTTVDPNGITIDGQNSVTLSPGENGAFRYSVATGEWEIR